MNKATILFTIISLISSAGYAQSLNQRLISADTLLVIHVHDSFLKEDPSDGSTAIKALFRFYKRYISSQDQQSCRFTPSCSEYAYESIKKNGFIFGIIDFFDRFARCNPLSSENYEPDFTVKRYKDPVE